MFKLYRPTLCQTTLLGAVKKLTFMHCVKDLSCQNFDSISIIQRLAQVICMAYALLAIAMDCLTIAMLVSIVSSLLLLLYL